MENTVHTGVRKRNYQLDFLKFIFALLVFWTHTASFIGENTKIILPPQLGQISVHFFFIVSGMLMVNSIIKQGDNTLYPAKSAINFVVKKYKSIGWQFIVSVLICLCASIYIYIYIYNEDILSNIIKCLVWIFPELFAVSSSGVWLFVNGPVWYFSAMLICMLPVAYLLYKKRDFTLYVFAPLTAILTLGYMCKSNNWIFIDHRELHEGFVMGSVIRAICGLCFGICAWTIYSKIKNANINKNVRILLTFTEVFLYSVFFSVWFFLKSNASIMSVTLILPIAIAITFSEKSYISSLFKFKWMRFFEPLSLAIFLNHRAASKIVENIFAGYSYKFCCCIMAVLTAVFCLLNWLIVILGKRLWEKKLKTVFTKPDNA